MMRLLAAFILSVWSTCSFSEPMKFFSAFNGGTCKGCQWTAAQGEIVSDTPRAFREYLKSGSPDTNGIPKRIAFNSPGGNLGAAIELGRIIRENNLSTAVARTEKSPSGNFYDDIDEAKCESACVFAFLGGVERQNNLLSGESYLGVHQFFAQTGGNISSEATQAIMGQLLLYILELNVNPEILSIASRIPPNEMHYFSREELSRLEITTERTFSPLRFDFESGRFAAVWEVPFTDPVRYHRARLSCDGTEKNWIFKAEENSGVGGWDFDDLDRYDDLLVHVGKRHKISKADIIQARGDGDKISVELRLPFDVRKYAGMELSFAFGTSNAVYGVLDFEVTLPGVEVLDALARSCGIDGPQEIGQSFSQRSKAQSNPRATTLVPPSIVQPNLASAPKPVSTTVNPEVTESRRLRATEDDEAQLNFDRTQRREIQRRLTLLGFDTKGVDGSFGPNSRSAIQAWQQQRSFPVSGFLNQAQKVLLFSDSQSLYDKWLADEAKKPKTRKKRRVRVCQRGPLGLLINCRTEWR